MQAEQLDAMAQHVERAALVELLADPVEQRLASRRAVVLRQRLPRLRLRRLHPGEDVGGEERAGAVVVARVAVCVEPAVRAEMGADLVLEADLFVEAQARAPVVIGPP